MNLNVEAPVGKVRLEGKVCDTFIRADKEGKNWFVLHPDYGENKKKVQKKRYVKVTRKQLEAGIEKFNKG